MLTMHLLQKKMGDSFVLDITNPPKFCPQCLEVGLTTKVKKFRLKADNILVLMCKNDQVGCLFEVAVFTRARSKFIFLFTVL